MKYALLTLWFERRRYFPGVLAVAFSGMLIALQVGIFWGLISVVSVPIVLSRADIWVAYPNTRSIDLARPIPNYWLDRVWRLSEIARADEYIQGMAVWKTNEEIAEVAIVAGCNLADDGLGPTTHLTPRQRSALAEPGTVIVDRGDLARLEIKAIGQSATINNHPIRVVGVMEGMGSLAGPFALCSLATARQLLNLREDQCTFLLAACSNRFEAPAAIGKLAEFPKFSVREANAFSLESKVHWLTKTKAGVAVTFVALLGLTVGAVVTSQTLYAATMASVRELAVLRALGIPRGRLRLFVIQQSFCVGMLGLLIGIPGSVALGVVARSVGTNADLAPWILWNTGGLTLLMALASGIFAMRSIGSAEPMSLLR